MSSAWKSVKPRLIFKPPVRFCLDTSSKLLTSNILKASPMLKSVISAKSILADSISRSIYTISLISLVMPAWPVKSSERGLADSIIIEFDFFKECRETFWLEFFGLRLNRNGLPLIKPYSLSKQDTRGDFKMFSLFVSSRLTARRKLMDLWSFLADFRSLR